MALIRTVIVSFAVAFLFPQLACPDEPAQDEAQQSVLAALENANAELVKGYQALPVVEENGIAGGGSYMPYDTAQQLWTAARNRVLAPLNSAEMAPLREYVIANFPPFSVERQNLALHAGVFGGYYSITDVLQKVNDLLAKIYHLLKAKGLRLQVTVESNPSEALFTLTSSAGLPIGKKSTKDTMTLVRGQYSYAVAKTGFKPILAPLNLVDESPARLICQLVAETEKAAALPCKGQEGN